MDWSRFSFEYRFDLSGFLPLIIRIEGRKEAAMSLLHLRTHDVQVGTPESGASMWGHPTKISPRSWQISCAS